MQRRPCSQIRAKNCTLWTLCVSAPLFKLIPRCMKHNVIVFVHTFGSHAADKHPAPSLWNIHQVVVWNKLCPFASVTHGTCTNMLHFSYNSIIQHVSNACMCIVLDCQRLPLIRNENHVIRTCNQIYEMWMCAREWEREREKYREVSLFPSTNITLWTLWKLLRNIANK